jgi:glutaconate CoA-transferase subunit A
MTAHADKRMTLADAAALVRDGDTVVAGGCCYSRTPWAMLLELLRAGRTDLTLARNLMCYEAELFLARGAAAKLVSAWVGIGLRWGIPKLFRERVERDPSIYEEWSHLSFGMRFLAASMGMPFLPTASLLGSDLLDRLPAQEMRCPFTDELLVAVPALVPDVALIHAHTVDAAGNAQVEGPVYMDVEYARAAKTVIVTAEEVVPTEAIVRHADRTIIPGFVVDAVVEVPFGAYPHECHGRYEADFAHFDAYTELVNQGGADGVEEYLREHLDEAGSFAGFLDGIGATGRGGPRPRARGGVAAGPPPPPPGG